MAAIYPTWYMAEREGFEPSIPFLAEYSLSRRAPSASRASLRNLTLSKYLFQRISKHHTQRRFALGSFKIFFSTPCIFNIFITFIKN
jgi:hypothetical protein